FLLRTFDPPLSAVVGKRVTGLRRLGKRIVFEMEDNLYIVFHLMIAGRLHWRPRGTRPAGKTALAAFEFEGGTLLLTEASSKKRLRCTSFAGRRRWPSSSAEAWRCCRRISPRFGKL